MKTIFEKISIKNFFSVGNMPIEIDFRLSPTTAVLGKNGEGKCLDRYTQIQIHINNPETEKKFLEFINERQNRPDN